MNPFYEDFPTEIEVCGESIQIITDFREYVRLIDILKDDEISSFEKKVLICQYFNDTPSDFFEAVEELSNFVTMEKLNSKSDNVSEQKENRKDVYSFKMDYPFIFSAFMHDYGINIKTIPYMHWWQFRMLFDGLNEENEIKQRIMYRSVNLSDIKDNNERKRIEKIQRSIKLPDNDVSDYEIGDAFEW